MEAPIELLSSENARLKIKMWIRLKMFLKPVWVGKIYGVEVYATHVARIWWFSNKFSIFQLKRM